LAFSRGWTGVFVKEVTWISTTSARKIRRIADVECTGHYAVAND
jgi:hypothetical protein